MLDPRLVKDIDASEQCRLTAYRDSLNLWTVGWGHLLDQSKDWTGFTITQIQADAWRDQDIASAAAQAAQLPEWCNLDTPCRQNAVIELVFNMGNSRYRGFVLTRAAISAQRWQDAHDGLLDSKWATQVHATRANRLANYLLTGEYP